MNTPRPSRATSAAATPKLVKRNPFDESPVLSRLTGNIVTPGIFQRGTSRLANAKGEGAGKKKGRAGKIESAATTTTAAAAATTSSFWSIEHMAAILPAEFHEKELFQEQAPPNPEYEAKAHAAIESFWSRNVIYVPSPDINRVGDAVMQKPKKMRVLKGQRHCTDTPAHSKTTGRKGRTVARKKGG